MRREVAGLGTRNFELNGTQLYKVVVGGVPYVYNGVLYAQGATIPYDAGGKYTNLAQLERDFNCGWIDPVD